MKKNILLLLTIVVFSSCGSSYLDTKPNHSTSPETLFETTKNAEKAINGLAKLMVSQYQSQGFNGEGTIKMYYGNYPGSHFCVHLPRWSNTLNGNNAINSTSVYTRYPWHYYYMIISNANTIIDRIVDARGLEEERLFIEAQARTFRAYSYGMLAQIYGNRWQDSNNGSTKGVVMRLEPGLEDKPVGTLAEIYEAVYEDLDVAIEYFKKSNIKRKSFYEPDINVAYAVYARMSLNKQDYETAEKYAKLAYADFPLMNNANYLAGFADETSEWIWGSYGASDENIYFYSYQSYIAYNSTAATVRNYPKCMSNDLYNKIPETDIRKGLFLDPGDVKYNKATGLITDKKFLAETRARFPKLQSNSQVLVYMQFKIACNDYPGVGNLVHLRSSEMMLIEAEANYFLNKEAKARELLVQLNRDTGRDPEYDCTYTGQALMDEIKLYRNIELWGEGFDWFDLKRWGDVRERRSQDKGGIFLETLSVNVKPEDNNRWTYVTPRAETDYNEDAR